MVYTTTSLKPVVGRILRTTRLTDLTYANDILEWLAEGLDLMLIRWRLDKTFMTLEVKDFTAKLPCGLVTLGAVIYRGKRLRKGTNSIDPRIKPWLTINSDIESYFISDTSVKPATINAQNSSLYKGSNITQSTNALTNADYYDLQYNYIKTPFEKGTIIIAYTKQPVDDEGYPLVPDIEEARAALFWYACMQIRITGYVFAIPEMNNLTYLEERATKYIRKAKNIIKEQSEDEKESTKQLLNNLIPPSNYYETFFMGGEQRKYME